MDARVRELRGRLRGCGCASAAALGRRLANARSPGELRELGRLVQQAEQWARDRRARAPVPRLDPSLPITSRAGEIAEAIREHPVVVVCGETGSGKSTQLPLICLQAGRGLRGMVGHTQPRRIAARTISRRLAEELGVPLGREVGFKVRFDDSTDRGTYIKVMTDGVLLTELRRDRGLLRYDTIILDEAHERSVNIDFLLGYVKRLLARRRDFRVVVTSATLDPEKFSRHFDGAPVIEVSGRTYPVEVRYRPPAADADADPMRPIVDAVEEVAGEGPGDVLVFLPGEREIREASAALRESGGPVAREAEIQPLYARLSAAEQLRAFQPHDRRRIILATNVAETSVTVPGVHYVVDTGLARISRYGSRSRVQGLEIEPISQASAAQRAGRCGRVADGVCIRLYEEHDLLLRAPFTDPEIVRSNLAGVVLRMKSLRLGEPKDFPFVDPPSPRRLRDAHDALVELAAVDAAGVLTAIGRELATVPVDPRLGRMILAAVGEGALREVLVIAACLASRDPRERPLEARDRADAAHAGFVDPNSDFLALLNIWRAVGAKASELSGRRYRRWCAENFLSWRALREWEDLHEQLCRIVRGLGYRANEAPAGYDAVHRALLTGLLGNIGTRGERYEYQGAMGAEFFLHPGSGLFERKPRWVMAAEMVRTDRLYARMVASIRPEWLETIGAHLLERSHSTPSWDDRVSAPVVVERVSLYGLRLPSKRRVHYGRVNPVHAREIFIRQGLVDGAFRPHADFVEHNERVILETRRMEAKARRRDLQMEAGARFDFFDRRVPAHVWSGKSFDRWRHKAEATHPRFLFMRREDLVVWAEEAPSPMAYPDAVQIAGNRRELEYHFEPGEPDDGVVLQLPLAAFADLDEARLDWLVPGLVGERSAEMLRGLPKTVRRGIGPVPQVVEEFLASDPDQAVPLVESLAAFVGRTKGVPIRAADLRARAVPGHLQPKIVVTGPDDSKVAEGRDLLRLKQQVSGEVEEAINAGQSETPTLQEARAWVFGDVPASTLVSSAEGTVLAYPAVVDREDIVSLRLFPEEASALAEHRRGVRRLLVITHRRLIRRMLSDWPAIGAMRLSYAAVGGRDSLEDELALLVVEVALEAVGAERLEGVRTEAEFLSLSDAVEEALGNSLAQSADLADRILRLARAVRSVLEGPHPPAWLSAVDDVREQLAVLLGDHPFSSRSVERLRQVPRYLAAAEVRLKKLATGGLDKDQRRSREIEPRWRRWMELREVLRDSGGFLGVRREAETYRWMLEEFRVSVFAQELGAAGRVSGARLDEQWARLREVVRQDGLTISGYSGE